MTAVLLGLGCWGTMLLQVEFQYVEFLPQDSRLYQWFQMHEEYFPGKGEMGAIYFANENLNE